MKDKDKTKQQLLRELAELRQRVAELEARDIERKLAEEALRNSQEQLALIVDGVPALIGYVDSDERYLYVNKAYAEWYGRSREDYIGKRIRDLLDERVYQRASPYYKAALSGQHVSFENKAYDKNGQERLVSVTFVPHFDDRGSAKAFFALIQDITERKQAEEALQQRNRDLDLLVRVGQTLSATLDPQEVTARLMKALVQAVGVEGSSVWLWDAEQPGGLVCRGAVYPGHKESLIGWWLGPGEGVATWVAQHGQSAIVPRASDDPRFSPRIDLQIGFRTASLLAVPLRVRDQVIGVLEVVNKHDGEFDAHDRFLVETLAPSAAIAIENARLVENLRQQTAELQTRNEELDTFAHTVAHDLKNPVGLIMGYAEVLAQDYAAMSDEQRERFLQTVARNGRKMKSIIEELLLLAQVRKMQVEREPLDMAVIVFEAQQRMADMIKECQAEIVLPAEWPIALGYAPWVEEVWVNYFSNAIKYGGLPPRLELGAAAESGGMVRFWVHDNGPGLAPEAEAQLFVPFTRLDQIRVKGHGLGLSIVRRIVEKLGGQVGEESQPGQGSTFFFTLHAASGKST